MIELNPICSLNPFRPAANLGPDCKTTDVAARSMQQVSDFGLGHYSDQIVDWGTKYLFSNYEKELDALATGATILDWGATGVVTALQGVVLISEISRYVFNHHFQSETAFARTLLPILQIPAYSIFLGAGAIEWAVEGGYLSRCSTLLNKMQSTSLDDFEKLSWIFNRYFCVQPTERDRITNYITSRLPTLSIAQQAEKYDQIAAKVLKIKYDALKRRVTPQLAEVIRKEIPLILKELQGPNNEQAMIRANELVSSIITQTKNKVISHFLKLLSITITLISVIAFFAGVTSPIFFGIFALLPILLMVTQFVFERGTLAKEVERFYDRVTSLNFFPWGTEPQEAIPVDPASLEMTDQRV